MPNAATIWLAPTYMENKPPWRGIRRHNGFSRMNTKTPFCSAGAKWGDEQPTE